MPNHIHLLISPKKKNLSECMRNLKRTISEEIKKKPEPVGQGYPCPTGSSIWQSSFQDIIVRNEGQLENFRNYIFQNPVKADLASAPEEYPFSSIGKETDRHRLSVGMQFPDHNPAILIGTSNVGKIQEISESLRNLPVEMVTPLDLPYIEETPIETENTFAKNALQKARFYFERSGLPTLADDSGIIVEALQKELGIHTRRWGAGPEASDQEWIEYFLNRMKKEKNKRARFVCVLAYIDAAGKEFFFEGTCDGVITETLEAKYLPGLPISACFRPDGFPQVYSAMSVEEKNRISHRGSAVTQFQEFMTLNNG